VSILHRLPGAIEDKETALANLKRYLSRDGVIYGATILGDPADHRINDAKNSRVGADTESKRKYREGCEAGILPQRAKRVARDLHKCSIMGKP
jgi:hypothetical protein